MTQPNLNQGIPAPSIPVTRQTGVDPGWYSFFAALWKRTGGAIASLGPLLDQIISSTGAMIYRSATEWTGLAIGSEFEVLRVTGAIPSWSLIDGNSFAQQGANKFFISPVDEEGIATFRLIETPDLDNVAGEFPGTRTDDDAAAGNIGEYIFSQVALGSAVALTNATAADITSITLTPGDWDVWGSLSTAPDTTTTLSNLQGWLNTAAVTDPGPPNNGAYVQSQTAPPGGKTETFSLGSMRVEVAAGGTKKVFLGTVMSFAISTMGAYGFVGARRRR